MIVDEVDVHCIATLEAKNDAPVAGDRNGPERREISLQSVKTHPGQPIHIFDFSRPVQNGKDAANAFQLILLDATFVVGFEEPLEAAMSKVQDHMLGLYIDKRLLSTFSLLWEKVPFGSADRRMRGRMNPACDRKYQAEPDSPA